MRSLALFLLAFTLNGFAQQSSQAQHVNIPHVEPRLDDVGSIDGMIKAWYDIVTVPKGQTPDWGRDHTLYIDDIRFVEIRQRKDGLVPHIVSHQQFADESAPIAVGGFYEREIHRVTERFGNIAHVWSTYESRRSADGPVIARGINSIELFYDGRRWWIANAVWDEETPTRPLPKEYLP